MTFTPLETAGITGFMSVMVALIVHALTKRNYVSHGQCEERRTHVCSTLQAVQAGHAELRQDLKERTNTLFRMVRGLIVHDKDMSPDVKADILNETPGGK
ncbi:hypothetical protein K9F62_16990 [Desulfovibrio sp. JY]|uniref:Uncharacterized protein n=1 Tax=Solidesulfovibrio fructosivorans JJ] TaxID=596151 RepID=E1JR15_SOLFR|nr:hypothetical protein [Solidesulfovibrio fructosivorans]EFL53016.1 hypothetical protein DesfrDRAFT_0064 [Solidesulfovibrio fructosivorans JJ]]UJX40378.1 hypothetical protein K9F62_16990 [Desulfovibrio sp. JY]